VTGPASSEAGLGTSPEGPRERSEGPSGELLEDRSPSTGP